MGNDQKSGVFERIEQSLRKCNSPERVVWWRGFITALDEWGLLEQSSKIFGILPLVRVEPSIDSFGFDFQIDAFDAAVEIPTSVLEEIESQPDTIPGDSASNEDVWMSRVDWKLDEGRKIVSHGQLRKLLLRRWKSLETAFYGKEMPSWLRIWWRGYIFALAERGVLTRMDAETFDSHIPEWSTPFE
jgi:hypothetical protein